MQLQHVQRLLPGHSHIKALANKTAGHFLSLLTGGKDVQPLKPGQKKLYPPNLA